MLYKVVLTFQSVKEILKCAYSRIPIQVKATKQYFSVVLFVMLYKVVLTFDSVNEILKRENIRMKLLSSKSNF